jgi:hypothetical protein
MEARQTRNLFSEEYIASNCTIAFDSSTSVDDTVGTYVTNYLIGVIGILFGILFLTKIYHCCGCFRREDAAECRTQNVALFWQAMYFFLAAAGYGIAGFQHQFYHTKEDLPDALVFGAASLVALSMVPLKLSITETWNISKTTSTVVRLVYVCIAAAVVILTVFFETLTAIGIYSFVVLALTACYYIHCFMCKGCQTMRYAAAMGNALIMAGFMVQVLLAKSCGSEEAYENCFRDCPLPTNPLLFNHNALFHVLVAVGLVSQAFGWFWWRPLVDIKCDSEGKNDKHDELFSSTV